MVDAEFSASFEVGLEARFVIADRTAQRVVRLFAPGRTVLIPATSMRDAP